MDQAYLTRYAGQVAKEGALTLLEGAYDLEARDGGKGCLQGLEAQRGSDQALELAVITLKPVVEALDLTVLGVRAELALLLKAVIAGP